MPARPWPAANRTVEGKAKAAHPCHGLSGLNRTEGQSEEAFPYLIRLVSTVNRGVISANGRPLRLATARGQTRCLQKP